MVSTIPKCTDLHIASADIPLPLVKETVEDLIKKMAPAYLNLIGEAIENPGRIQNLSETLFSEYVQTADIIQKILEAQQVGINYKVIKKNITQEKTISVFFEKMKEIERGSTIETGRCHIKIMVEASDVNAEGLDPLDQLLIQLKKKILSLGYEDDGLFDIRLDKGSFSMQGDAWKWHHDGIAFQTSVTVCYSNLKNWSTQVSDSGESRKKPADHGYLYDALKVFHRSPLPCDLKGQEVSANDYRLFIRYTVRKKNMIAESMKSIENNVKTSPKNVINIDPYDYRQSKTLSNLLTNEKLIYQTPTLPQLRMNLEGISSLSQVGRSTLSEELLKLLSLTKEQAKNQK